MITLLVLIILLGLWVIFMFNGLVVLKNRVDEALSDIDVQLKRRHDLIPNLVSTVQGYAVHERQLFEQVTNARSQAVSAGAAGNMQAKAEAENMLTNTLRSLFAVAEAYPDLKANQNFLSLQEELADTENKIMSSRRFYNTNVRDYNIRRESFPVNLLAKQFGFGKRDLFELEDIKEKELPRVDFSSTPPPAPQPAPTPVPVQEQPSFPSTPVDQGPQIAATPEEEPTTTPEEPNNNNQLL